jgi:L,D-peptidoglycan transpeptidase YkuD (ErfK/YbiS/YcfS/YnhG family)
MKPQSFSLLRVRRIAGSKHQGKLMVGGRTIPCAIGAKGVRADKREGDGASPRGRFRLIGLWRRPDRRAIFSLLPTIRTRPDDGWCDAPDHRLYNRPVRLPFAASHEELWRTDGLYDLVIDVAWNRGPIVKGRGSAIFIHAARPDFSGTAGCVAVAPAELRWLVERLSRRTKIEIA